MSERNGLLESRFFNCTVRTWQIDHCYPFRFSVQMDGDVEHTFAGVPNYCDTRHSALMRGWWRAKWLHTGELSNRYK